MPAPVISAASSILGFKRREQFAFTPAATNSPLTWAAVGLPDTVTIDTPANFACTGVASTDVITATGHDFVDGSRVYFAAITGGAGLAANTIYFVRDKSGHTFKLATSATGAAIDFTTDISAGTIRRVSTGTVSGYFDLPGPKVVTLSATAGDATTGSREFVFGVSSEIAPSVASGDVTCEWDFDLVTRALAPASPIDASPTTALGADAPLAHWKKDDIFLVRIRTKKNGVVVDPDPTALTITLKEYDPEPAAALSSTFVRSAATGVDSYFDLLVNLTGDNVKAALANYEEDTGTTFLARIELQLECEIDFNATTQTIRLSSRTGHVRLDRDQVDDE